MPFKLRVAGTDGLLKPGNEHVTSRPSDSIMRLQMPSKTCAVSGGRPAWGDPFPTFPALTQCVKLHWWKIDRKSRATHLWRTRRCLPRHCRSPSFRLNTSINSGQDSPAVAGLTDGRFVAVWRDLGAGGLGTLKYAIFNADGSVAKSEAIANQNTTGVIEAGDVAVAALTGGGFALTWSSRLNNQNDIFHRVFDASGTAVSTDLTSNLGATLQDQRHPDIVGDGAGGFYVVWEDTESTPTGPVRPNVQLRHFDAAGLPVGISHRG